MAGKYDEWSQEQLIARIQELENQVKTAQSTSDTVAAKGDSIPSLPDPNAASKPLPYRKPPKAPPKAFDASKYSTRLIALKFAYLGQKYNGFEHHRNNKTQLPTIEEEMWKALVKTRLINPTPTGSDATDYGRVDRKVFAQWDREGADVNWDGCEYSKCGRTDRGVSAFGQVIGIRVRSNRPLPREEAEVATENAQGETKFDQTLEEVSTEEPTKPKKPFNDVADEVSYISLLNKVLPPDIRVYAWCPNPPDNFSARFSCKERRYKYFFTNPCFAPVPGSSGIYSSTDTNAALIREGWLDIAAMKEACKLLEGLHDFRNFCKVDASKQLTNFKRRIFHADIEEISPLAIPEFLSHDAVQNVSKNGNSDAPKMYSFNLHGSAFLWHQVRSIVAILFLIGQRLEPPSLITSLLDMDANPTRPKYEMATDAPLVLWDCIFPHESEVQSAEERQHGYEDRLEWMYVGDEGGAESPSMSKSKRAGVSTFGPGKWGRGGVIDDVWEVWRRNKIDETLSSLLLDKIAAQGKATLDAHAARGDVTAGIAKGGSRLFDGGDFGRAKGTYQPLLTRERQEPVEVVNERYAKRKGWDVNPRKRFDDDGDE